MTTTEKDLETFICESLMAQGGYQVVKVGTAPEFMEDFDRARGLDLVELFAFIGATQEQEWERLVKLHGSASSAKTKFADRVAKQIDLRGTVDVLRHGVDDLGVRIRLAYFKPAHGLTPELLERYQANRLTVTRQFLYEPNSHKTIDLCLMVNGIPVATAELKNQLTGQNIEHAIGQYRRDRDPKNLSLSKRAVVHFAVDPEAVAMTTRLAGNRTRFLPFNKGHNRGPGNPPNPDGHRTAYLWENVWSRDAWLDLIARFIHAEPAPKGARAPAQILFPRYHQWDAVLKLEADAKAHGAGKSYLVEHSAGSGKSNTIAWLAHRLSTLHGSDDTKLFDKVVVITDRKVLDQQLQNTIYQFEHAHGVVEKIDTDSHQLEQALSGETARIIITTLQKFPVVAKRGIDLPNRRYAVIIDEAHSSQTGDSAKDLKSALSGNDEVELTAAEAEDAGLFVAAENPAEDALAQMVSARGQQPNISFFAFTATPKARTLEMFGPFDPVQNRHVPFHLYSMRQAIEEGFILDVLANYTTYETYWQLEKKTLDDPKYETKKAQQAIARFVSLHEYNLAQKSEVIVEHFRTHVAHKIGGKAKAMVVTSSRLHAIRYKQALDKYIREHGYGDLGLLIAFSGTVTDRGLDFTEQGMNGFPESQTAEQFATEQFHIMVVAEKFQTGFDQPLLYAMYVDKPLVGLAAVQTLSRLNRITEGKDGTFVLDFRNEAEAIREAFEPWYSQTVAPPSDPNLIFDTRSHLDEFGVLRSDEILALTELLVLPDDPSATARIYAGLAPAVDRFNDLSDDDQLLFRDRLNKFTRTYSFISQIVDFGSIEMERDYLYCKALASMIRTTGGNTIDLGSEVELSHLRQEMTFEGSVALKPGDGVVVSLPGEGTGRAAPVEESLSGIIARMNEKYGANLSESDRVFFDRVFEQMAKDPVLQLEASANSVEDFGQGFEPRFLSAVVDEISNNEQAAKRALDDEELRRELIDAGRPWVHARAKVARLRVAPIGELLGPDREDQHLEYKSTLRWDVQAETKTSIPEDAVVKTIAGFANSEHGGTLVIGVRDDGSIFGLQRDYLTFSKRGQRGDHDLLGQHLQNLVVQRLGEAAATLVEWEFFQIDGEDLCRVNVSPSGFPVYETKGGQRIFWWRYATGTMRIADDREREQVILRRWQG